MELSYTDIWGYVLFEGQFYIMIILGIYALFGLLRSKRKLLSPANLLKIGHLPNYIDLPLAVH